MVESRNSAYHKYGSRSQSRIPDFGIASPDPCPGSWIFWFWVPVPVQVSNFLGDPASPSCPFCPGLATLNESQRIATGLNTLNRRTCTNLGKKIHSPGYLFESRSQSRVRDFSDVSPGPESRKFRILVPVPVPDFIMSPGPGFRLRFPYPGPVNYILLVQLYSKSGMHCQNDFFKIN